MGEDGARGLLKLNQAGGLSLALRKEDCAVFGMPKAALDLGAAPRAYSLEEIIKMVLTISKKKVGSNV